MLQEISRLIAQVKGDPAMESRISPQSSLDRDLGIDSLQLVNLILLVEAEFDIEIDFNTFERQHLASVASFCAFIEDSRGAPALT